MSDNAGLSQEEIDSLLAGSGLDDFDSSYIPDEDDIFSVDSGPTESQISTEIITKQKSTSKFDTVKPEEYLNHPNLKLINDIKMSLTVEIGRAKMSVSDILQLGDGSIVELDKMQGELVDILVNGMLIAKGTIISVTDYFGVKITEIINPEERYKFLLS